MVAAVTLESSQDFVTTVNAAVAPEVQGSNAFVAALVSYPADFVDTSSARMTVIASGNEFVDTSQAYVTALARGSVSDPKVRAWTFTLDGHDFYILRLGNEETLVYDLTSEQWYSWGTGDNSLWQAYTGINWTGGNRFSSVAGSNVTVGADSNGTIWFLDPDSDMDEGLFVENAPTPFLRRVTGQVLSKGYGRYRVNQVQLLGSIGSLSNDTLDTVTLSYSDDRGNSYVPAGTITLAGTDYAARANWRSLGSFSQPGRLFRVEDYGALRRVDSLTMETDMGDGS
jgi:hypothetical protein